MPSALADLSYERESLSLVWDELLPLLEAHHAEVQVTLEPLDIQQSAYLRLDELGLMYLVTARMDGNLVGYSLHIVSQSLRFQTFLEATHDALYVMPAARSLNTLVDLIRASEGILADAGVRWVTQHVGSGKDFGRILTGLGYERVESIYRKALGGL